MYGSDKMPIKYPVSEDRPFFQSSHWPMGVPHQLDIDFTLTLADMLKESASKWPEDPVIWFLDTMVTYKELHAYVLQFKSTLYKMGLKKGEVVSLYLPNCIQYVVAYYAITSLGAIASGVNPTYKPGEILHQLRLTNSKKLIVLDSLYAQTFSSILPEWDLDWIIYTNILDLAKGMNPLKKWAGKLIGKIPKGKVTNPKARSFLDCLNSGKTSEEIPPIKIDPAIDTAALIMTGGTTGVPKAAELTHENIISNAKQAGIYISQHRDLNQDEKHQIRLGHGSGLIGVIPLFHSYAHTIVMNAVISEGAWMVLFPMPPPSRELVKTLHSLPNLNYFGYAGVEILFHRLAELPPSFLKKYPLEDILKLNISGAGPLHDYVRQPFEANIGTPIIETYGLTEASPAVSINNIYGPRDLGTVGCPVPGTDWAIFPSDDFSLGPLSYSNPKEEDIGELCVSGPQVMKGYFRDPERTAETIKIWDNRRWLLTGDIACMREDGRAVILDRKKQLIKMAGHSVFPAEVENLIGQHPDVLEVAVAGLPDPKTGEAVKAWIAIKPSAMGAISIDQIREWCEEKITYWKIPKYIEFVDSIPKNVIGKVLRRELQEADPLFKKQS